MTFITIQEAASILKCSTRSVYRKIDAIDTFESLCQKGFAQYEIHSNGNNRRLFSKQWINEALVKNQANKKQRIVLNGDAFELLKEQLTIKDNQIDQLSENLNLALNRIAELQKYFHINGLENGPTLTPTKKYLEEHPDSVLNYNSGEESEKYSEAAEEINEPQKDSEKSISDWLKSFR